MEDIFFIFVFTQFSDKTKKNHSFCLLKDGEFLKYKIKIRKYLKESTQIVSATFIRAGSEKVIAVDVFCRSDLKRKTCDPVRAQDKMERSQGKGWFRLSQGSP